MEESVTNGHDVMGYKRRDKPKCSCSMEVVNLEPKGSHWTETEFHQLMGQSTHDKQRKDNQNFITASAYPSSSIMQASQASAAQVPNNNAFLSLHHGKEGELHGPEEEVPQYDVTLMEEKLQPIEQQLQYLLKKAEEFQTHLVYRDRIHNEEFARAVPIFVKTCQPYFAYLESTARSIHSDRKPLPKYIQKRLLQFSQHLASSLEQLVLMYASFGFISLEETDPCSICYFYRGEFRLGHWFRVSTFRYCMPVPYTAAKEPALLFKKIRWNVDISEGTSFGDAMEPCTEYYFLCFKEANQVVDTAQPGSKSTAATAKSRRLWSIGRWIQVEPSPGEPDLLCWFLYKQPRGDYQLLITIGFEEPSQIAATDLLVDILLGQRSADCPGTCLSQSKQFSYLEVQSHPDLLTSSCQGVSVQPHSNTFTA
ncbi:UPF0575 protein C19orf67 homolog isoform X2 [Scyliorhinus canicula]|uniref:UPF0575 protein C19orf67 homolog isoform X2 n=1 Tax=Scyliorhinus canicula TaxID=7830 RepID=UPI0018F69363|nr:UPF0575 protein C19orf67 homolog isoform X2 [Scyliorhinus canicula]